MSKKKIAILISLPLLAAACLFFVSYWAYASRAVKEFTSIDYFSAGDGDYISLRGSDIHYIKKGGGEEEILLVHGFGGGAFSYRNNIGELARYYTVYAIDLKGFGYSQRTLGTDYSHLEQARILLDFLEKKDISEVTAAGHSMGGAVVILAYHMEPERFKRLVLIDSAGLDNHPPLLSSLFSQPLADILYYNLAVDEDNFARFLKSSFFQDNLVDRDLTEIYRRPFMVKDTNFALREMVNDMGGYEVESILENIDIPVLIVWGRQDSWIAIDHAYRFGRLIEDSKLVVIDRCGHLPMEEQGERFNRVVLDFMQ